MGIELRLTAEMDRCLRELMIVVGMTEEAQPGAELLVNDVCRVYELAKAEIMNLRAERTRARFDAEDEHYTTEDAVTAALFPALPFLKRMADTYQERRDSYGPSEQRFADIMLAMFPNGLHLQTRSDWVRYGLFHQIISKISRYVKDFATPHVDSIHDIGPYSAMLEAEDRRTLNRPPFNFRSDDHGD
jgi:hypothetical protein